MCGGNHDSKPIPNDIYEIDPNHKHTFYKKYETWDYRWVRDCKNKDGTNNGCIESIEVK